MTREIHSARGGPLRPRWPTRYRAYDPVAGEPAPDSIALRQGVPGLPSRGAWQGNDRSENPALNICEGWDFMMTAGGMVT